MLEDSNKLEDIVTRIKTNGNRLFCGYLVAVWPYTGEPVRGITYNKP